MTFNIIPPYPLGSFENVYSGGTLLNDGGTAIKNIRLIDGNQADVQRFLLKSELMKKA
jgi:uncharacterized Zn ribbon protein